MSFLHRQLCCIKISSGAVGGASDYFSDVAASRIQQQYLSESSSHKISIGDEDRSIQSSRVLGLNDSSPKQPKNLHSNSIKEISNAHVVMAAGQAANSGSSNLSLYNTPSPVASQVCLNIRSHRRYFYDCYCALKTYSCCNCHISL